jgi:electron transport complex protein RnfG
MNEQNSKSLQKKGSDATVAINASGASAVRLVATLTVVTTMSGVVLAGMHKLTKDRIKAQHKRAKMSGVNKVLPKCTNDPVKDAVQVKDRRGKNVTVYRCRKGGRKGEVTAVAIVVDSKSNKNQPYSGLMHVLVSLDTETGKIRSYKCAKGKKEVGVAILRHSETPGLGSKIEDFAFRKAFAGRDLKGKDTTSDGKKWLVSKDDPSGFVDSISGATISSRTVTEMVHRALLVYDTKRNKILTGKATGPAKPPPGLEPGARPRPAGPTKKKITTRIDVTKKHVLMVLSGCVNDPMKDTVLVKDPRGKVTTVYRCRKPHPSGRPAISSVAIERDSTGAEHKPYKGMMQIIVAVDVKTEKILTLKTKKGPEVGVAVIQHHEDKNMGSQIETYAFRKVFAGQGLKGKDDTLAGKKWSVNKIPGEGPGLVDAISAATISTWAATELVLRALRVYNANRKAIVSDLITVKMPWPFKPLCVDAAEPSGR